MKKILTTLLVFITFMSFSQTKDSFSFKSVFLGEDAQSYKNLYLKLKSNQSSLGHKFYGYLPTKNYQEPVYSPDKKYKFNTDTASLINRIFKVVDIVNNGLPYDNIFIKITDIKNNEILFVKYDHKYDFSFPFLVSGFEFTKEYLKKDIEIKIDDFENDTTYISPDQVVKLIKVKKKTKESYYLSLKTYSSTSSLSNKGIILIFTDGTKWIKPEEKIDIKYTESTYNSYQYSAFVSLSKEDIKIFSTKEIKKYRLYIFDREIDEELGLKIKFYTQIIKEIK